MIVIFDPIVSSVWFLKQNQNHFYKYEVAHSQLGKNGMKWKLLEIK